MSRTARPISTPRPTRDAGPVRTVRAALRAAAVTCVAFGLGACSEGVEAVDRVVDETYEVTYEVTGTNVDEIVFHGGGGTAMKPELETVKSPTLPWKKTVTLRGIMPPAVMPLALSDGEAEIACTITYKGKVIEEAEGETIAAAGGCVAVSPL